MRDAAAYAEMIAAEIDEIVELTANLVAVDSPTDDAAGVERVAQITTTALERAGCAVELLQMPGCGPLLDARLTLGTGPVVLWLGHSDTVWPPGTAAEWAFGARDGRLTGPGVGDMKCCLATAVAALRALAARPPPDLGGVRLLVVPDEERGSVASRASIERACREVAACLTLEAARPGGVLVTGRAAVGAMRIAASGVSRHVTDTGTPASALSPLAALVALIEQLGEVARGVQASVGVLRGGTSRQIVPGEACMLIDLRAPTTEQAAALADDIRRLVGDVHPVEGVQLRAEGGVTRPAAPRSAGALALFELARSAADTLGWSLLEVVSRGGSDACFPAALGVPTLDGLGPICHSSCSRDEWVETASIPIFGALLAAVSAGAARRCADAT
jgi:glutamate carboxypeptidase